MVQSRFCKPFESLRGSPDPVERVGAPREEPLQEWGLGGAGDRKTSGEREKGKDATTASGRP